MFDSAIRTLPLVSGALNSLAEGFPCRPNNPVARCYPNNPAKVPGPRAAAGHLDHTPPQERSSLAATSPRPDHSACPTQKNLGLRPSPIAFSRILQRPLARNLNRRPARLPNASQIPEIRLNDAPKPHHNRPPTVLTIPSHAIPTRRSWRDTRGVHQARTATVAPVRTGAFSDPSARPCIIGH